MDTRQVDTRDGFEEALTSAALSAVEAALLETLAASGFPVGARLAQQRLIESGHDVSEASVSRMLARFDALGLTEQAGKKGRVTTPTGRRLGEYIFDARRRNAAHEHALDISTIEQLFDLLYARRGIESESARSAAERSSTGDLRRLTDLLHEHRGRLASGDVARKCAMSFHREVCRLSANPLLMAVSDTVLNERLDYLERVLDVVAAGHLSLDRSADDHGAILDAIAGGRPDDAYTAMHTHLTRLIHEVEEFAASSRAPVFTSVLDLAQQ